MDSISNYGLIFSYEGQVSVFSSWGPASKATIDLCWRSTLEKWQHFRASYLKFWLGSQVMPLIPISQTEDWIIFSLFVSKHYQYKNNASWRIGHKSFATKYVRINDFNFLFCPNSFFSILKNWNFGKLITTRFKKNICSTCRREELTSYLSYYIHTSMKV